MRKTLANKIPLVASFAIFSGLALADSSDQSQINKVVPVPDIPSWRKNPQPVSHPEDSPFQALSARSPQNDDGYPSADAEAKALGLSGGFRTIPSSPSMRRNFNIAHGILMALAFTLWFPLGAIIMHTTHRVWLHAAVQSFAYINAIAGMCLGIWLGKNVRYLDYAHTVIGMAVMAALVIQVALGVWTHWRFAAEKERKEKRESKMPKMPRWFNRGFPHRSLGRSLIALAIINGGLGLKLAQNTRGGEIAYGIVAGIVGSAYLTLLVTRSWKRYQMTKEEVMAPEGGMMMT
jgi:hypothetical protein